MRRMLILAIVSAMTAALGFSTAGATSAGAPSLADWQRAARTGSITLPLEGRDVTLSLRDNPIVSPEARASLKRHGHDISDIQILQGEVAGDPGSIARITVSDSEAIGYIRTSAGSFDIGANPRGEDIRRPALTGLKIDDGAPAELHFDCEGWTPGHYATEGLVGGQWGSRITFDLAVVVDQTYVTQWSKGDGNWLNDALATVNSADGIYDQLQIDINLVDIHSDLFPNSDSTQLLTDIKFHYRAYHPEMNRDAVALLVYKEIGPLGQASCIGSAGMDDRANLVMTTNSAPFNLLGVQLYSNIYGKTLAHEMGHLLRAHHHYSNCVQATREPISDACTLMTPFVDELDEVIGSVEAVVMRGWANDHL